MLTVSSEGCSYPISSSQAAVFDPRPPASTTRSEANSRLPWAESIWTPVIRLRSSELVSPMAAPWTISTFGRARTRVRSTWSISGRVALIVLIVELARARHPHGPQ